MTAKTINRYRIALTATALIALSFILGHHFSDAPWTKHTEVARTVMYCVVIATFILNRKENLPS